jgi:CRP-like cAMP-binding protein
MVDTELLAALPLFHDAAPNVVSALAKRGVEVRYPANAVLFLAGASAAGWFIIVEGTVRVVRGSGSRQHVIHTEVAGGTLGEVPLFTQRTHPATGIAAEPDALRVVQPRRARGGDCRSAFDRVPPCSTTRVSRRAVGRATA